MVFSETVDIRGRPLYSTEPYKDDLGIFYGVSSGVLLTGQEMDKRTRELAEDINKIYRGLNVVLACIMNGGRYFLEKLEPYLDIDYNVVEIDAKSYGRGTVSSREVKIEVDHPELLEGEHILIVEDIIDTRRTMDTVLEFIREHSPESLRVVVGLDKPSRAEVKLPTDVEMGIGYTIDDHYVFGYGLDAWGYDSLREVPHVAVLDPQYYDPEKGLSEVLGLSTTIPFLFSLLGYLPSYTKKLIQGKISNAEKEALSLLLRIKGEKLKERILS